MQQDEGRESIRQYLLGSLNDERSDLIEERLLTDAGLQEELSAAQDDLIDEYLADALPVRDRALFESHFLSTPERLHEFRLARALMNYADAGAADTSGAEGAGADGLRRKFMRMFETRALAVAAASVVAALVLGYVALEAYRHARPEQQLARLRRNRQAVERELARLNKEPLAEYPHSTITAVTLRLNTLRESGEMRRLTVMHEATVLQLRLELPEDRGLTYQAVVETEDGDGLFIVRDLKATDAGDGKVVVLHLPGRLLPAGDYQVHLGGTTQEGRDVEVGTYPFQVVLQ